MDVISYVNALPLAGLAVHGAMPAVNRAYTTDTVEAHNARAFNLADTPSTTKAAFTIPSLVAPERLLERARKLEAEIDALGSVAIPAEDGKHGAVEAALQFVNTLPTVELVSEAAASEIIDDLEAELGDLAEISAELGWFDGEELRLDMPAHATEDRWNDFAQESSLGSSSVALGDVASTLDEAVLPASWLSENWLPPALEDIRAATLSLDHIQLEMAQNRVDAILPPRIRFPDGETEESREEDWLDDEPEHRHNHEQHSSYSFSPVETLSLMVDDGYGEYRAGEASSSILSMPHAFEIVPPRMTFAERSESERRLAAEVDEFLQQEALVDESLSQSNEHRHETFLHLESSPFFASTPLMPFRKEPSDDLAEASETNARDVGADDAHLLGGGESHVDIYVEGRYETIRSLSAEMQGVCTMLRRELARWDAPAYVNAISGQLFSPAQTATETSFSSAKLIEAEQRPLGNVKKESLSTDSMLYTMRHQTKTLLEACRVVETASEALPE